MNFLPSAANNEFVYLVCLEEVVQNLLETQEGRISATAAAAELSQEPHMYVQCKMDFTAAGERRVEPSSVRTAWHSVKRRWSTPT